MGLSPAKLSKGMLQGTPSTFWTESITGTLPDSPVLSQDHPILRLPSELLVLILSCINRTAPFDPLAISQIDRLGHLTPTPQNFPKYYPYLAAQNLLLTCKELFFSLHPFIRWIDPIEIQNSVVGFFSVPCTHTAETGEKIPSGTIYLLLNEKGTFDSVCVKTLLIDGEPSIKTESVKTSGTWGISRCLYVFIIIS